MYGNFKSISRAARRGHIAEFRTSFGEQVLFRPVKSDKQGCTNRHNGGGTNRHVKGAAWLATENVLTKYPVGNNQKLTLL